MNIFDEDDRVAKLMFKEMTSTKPISREDEAALFAEYRTATRERKDQIRNCIVSANLRFALKAAMLYKDVPKVSITDMVSEANLGLLKAFDTYNPNSKIKFISWAVWQIRHRFSKYFDGIDMIRIPTHQKTKLNLKRKELDVDQFDDKTAFFHNITQAPVSLDSPCNEEESDCKLSDIIEDTHADNAERRTYTRLAQKSILDVIDNTLTQDEVAVIKSIYGVGTERGRGSLEDASVAINKSHERVRQIRDRALGKLSKQDKIKELKNILVECAESNNL